MAFRRVWNFIKNHKKKFLVAGALVGGVVLLNRYSQRKIREWEENEMSEYFDRMKREQHFESTQKTFRSTLLGLMPKLHERIMMLANCESIAALLKEKPPNKLELWEELKRLAFTRVIAEVYGLCLMITILNVQLSILGGYMFLDAAPAALPFNGSTDLPRDTKRYQKAPLQVQQKYLNLIQNFMGPGCEALLSKILTSVRHCVDCIALTEKLTVSNLKCIIDAARKDFEATLERDNISLFSLVIQDDVKDSIESSTPNDHVDDVLYQKLLNETKDIFESDDWKDVTTQTVESAFNHVLDGMLDHFSSNQTHQQFCNPNDLTLPMAKVIPIFVGLMNSLYVDRAEQFASYLLFSENQKTFGANIYEAFSRLPDSKN